MIVNAAAYTAVDKAESEPEQAMAINGIAPGIMAEEAQRPNAAMVHYSTDYVFDGTKSGAYVEDDVAQPVRASTATPSLPAKKRSGSRWPHLIFRTSWVYGHHSTNFMKTMLRLAQERDHLRVVADQIGAPTSNDAIAQATARCLARYLAAADSRETLGGLYHMTCAGQTSWHGFATAIFAEFLPESDRQRLKVEAIATEAYPTPARRPRNSVLSNAKLLAGFGVGLPDWRSALHQVRASA